VVISSKENQMKKLQQLTTLDENKENEDNVSKFSKLETDLKTYETLVSELNKLSAEEQNISNKLFPDNLKVCLNLFFVINFIVFIIFCLNFKEITMTCQNNEPSESKENNQTKEITRKKQKTSNETKKQITGK